MTERPMPEWEVSPHQKTHDYRSAYTGYWRSEAVCRIRIFAAPDQVPVVVASEFAENTGTSIYVSWNRPA